MLFSHDFLWPSLQSEDELWTKSASFSSGAAAGPPKTANSAEVAGSAAADFAATGGGGAGEAGDFTTFFDRLRRLMRRDLKFFKGQNLKIFKFAKIFAKIEQKIR